MKNITSLDELKLPDRQIGFLREFLRSVGSLKNVKRVILFGSAARGEFRSENTYDSEGYIRFRSDLDLMVVGDNICEDDEEIIFGDYGLSLESWVNNDVMVRKEKDMVEGIECFGGLEWRINRDGIDLTSLITKEMEGGKI